MVSATPVARKRASTAALPTPSVRQGNAIALGPGAVVVQQAAGANQEGVGLGDRAAHAGVLRRWTQGIPPVVMYRDHDAERLFEVDAIESATVGPLLLIKPM